MFHKWFVPLKQNGTAKISLFCFPHAGGSASFFRKWSDKLLDQVDLFSLQLPGREERFSEPTIKDIHTLVELLTKIFLSTKLDSKFVFFGHSIGSLICFELAKSLYEMGSVYPSHLILSSHTPPSIPFIEYVSNLPKEQFIKHLLKYEAIPKEIIQHKEILELFLPFIQADFSLSESYRYHYTLPIPIPLTIWYGDQDKTINTQEIDKWDLETLSSVTLKKFIGDHFYINTPANNIINEVNNIMLKY